jgi:hypothetical protein
VSATERVLEQGRALVRAIEALDTIEPTSPIERAAMWFLIRAYMLRLRGLVATAPVSVAGEILSESQYIDEDRAAVWMSES